jgi:RNA recognition motif-containing protein
VIPIPAALEADDKFSAFLVSEHGAKITSVKIVRDRVTGRSKNFGFAQFVSVQDAEDFVLPK